ncbi:MAG TPA: flagellar biosynthesis protein FlhF [Sulfurovum sp.]|nr:flagellar biosynthesis protein FlhF [Sulfurovum sp.]
MINETFVASNPTDAYAQAVEKYGDTISLVAAKQIKYEDGVLRSEVIIAVPEELFREQSFGLSNNENHQDKEDEALLCQIDELKAQLELLKDDIYQELEKGNTVITEVKKLFVKKGISSLWLDSIFQALIGTDIIEDASLLVSYLLEEIDASLQIRDEDFSVPKIMMLVGPTGVGKTTTIAKLAARYAYLLEKPYKVALVNLDSYKVGAVEQLEHYADIMQIEHICLSDVDSFKDTLEKRLSDYDVILVDTAGMSPYDTHKFIKTVEFVKTQTPKKLEVHLVLSATVKYEDMEDIYKNFSFLNLDSLIISKFDETKHFGTLLNFMLLYKLPMSYFSTGQEVPDDLLFADKEFLLEKFIGDIDEG